MIWETGGLVPLPLWVRGYRGGLKLSVPPNPHPTHVWGGGWEKGKNRRSRRRKKISII
jgi:hypothetical protein